MKNYNNNKKAFSETSTEIKMPGLRILGNVGQTQLQTHFQEKMLEV